MQGAEAVGASCAPCWRTEGSCDARVSLGAGPMGGECLAGTWVESFSFTWERNCLQFRLEM